MISKILLTGAAGALGSELRAPLSKLCKTLLSTDLKPAPGPLLPNESWAQADMGVMDEVAPMMEGVEMVVHFASRPDEGPFDELLHSNFLSAYNVWEAGYRAGARRIVFASSVHAVGMHETAAGIDTNAAHRPDTYYGLAKCFAEDMAQMYWEKRGLETVSMRIFSCTPKPGNVRALGTWLSYPDLVRMVTAAVTAHTVGNTIVYGVSANTRAPVSNERVSFLGYHPQDNAEDYAAELMAAASPADPQDPAQMRLGGPFATVELGHSGVAGIKAMSKT